MKVCFLHVRQAPDHALKMLASIREVMPWTEIVHMADMDEPALTASVQREPWGGENVMEYRLRHLSMLPEGEWLSVDTDMVIQHDLSKVFAFPFDVAVTQRDGPIWDTNGNDIVKYMPYNAGVVWWRNAQFWKDAHAWILQQPDAIKRWYGDQLALHVLVPKYNALKLHCDNFNYSPRRADEDVSGRFVVHYKGERKGWMLQ